MHWTKSKLKDQVDCLRGAVNEKLRCALDDGNAEEVRNTLEEIKAVACELLYEKPDWTELAKDPDDAALLSEERDRVAGLGIPTVESAAVKYSEAQTQLQRAASGAAVGSAIARDVFDSAKKGLDGELKKHMRPITELRRLVMEE